MLWRKWLWIVDRLHKYTCEWVRSGKIYKKWVRNIFNLFNLSHLLAYTFNLSLKHEEKKKERIKRQIFFRWLKANIVVTYNGKCAAHILILKKLYDLNPFPFYLKNEYWAGALSIKHKLFVTFAVVFFNILLQKYK